MRYIVFGVHKCNDNDAEVEEQDYLLVEHHTDVYGKALFWADRNSCHEYKARIWDNHTRKFIAY